LISIPSTGAEYVKESNANAHLERLIEDDEWVENFQSKLKNGRNYNCLEWNGTLDKAGYGRIHVKKHHETGTGRNFFAHRVNYAIETGEILDPDEFILHQCHNRLCCNVDHFEIGNHSANMDDLANSRRIAGENNPRSKVSQADVYEILELYYYGDIENNNPYTVKELVSLFSDTGITSSAINDIVSGRTWKDAYNDFWSEEDEER
tara:strand:+ start:899 stop:1516 length:618 start_codon:yes stop_codon:yes gene_type:complete